MAAKVFEVGDILPATTQLRIYVCTANVETEEDYSVHSVNKHNGVWIASFYIYEDEDTNVFIKIGGVIIKDHYVGYDANNLYIIDTSNLTLEQRTITYVDEFDDDNFITWEDLNATSGYTISFNSNGGTTISDIEDATELPTSLPTPTKSGYTFVAWYYESNFQTRAKAGDTIEENTTLYAKWHNLGSLFTEIANAIRSKDGTSENIRDVDFGERVKQIQGAIELTQTQYDALETKDANTYYLIVEEE